MNKKQMVKILKEIKEKSGMKNDEFLAYANSLMVKATKQGKTMSQVLEDEQKK